MAPRLNPLNGIRSAQGAVCDNRISTNVPPLSPRIPRQVVGFTVDMFRYAGLDIIYISVMRIA